VAVYILNPNKVVRLCRWVVYLFSVAHSIASSWQITPHWKGINCKQSTRWQHPSRLKAGAFFSLQFFLLIMKHSNLYLGLVLPSGGWQSLIVKCSLSSLISMENSNLGVNDQPPIFKTVINRVMNYSLMMSCLLPQRVKKSNLTWAKCHKTFTAVFYKCS
jgi:hypothetical protein